MNRLAWATYLSPLTRAPPLRTVCTQRMASHPPSKRERAIMKVAVVGCAHGELDAIYGAIREAEQARNIKVELVICPGDFQAVRNTADLECMACPVKYRDMRSFWKYYAGHVKAPVPTIFVGGNHEASNHLQEIPLGGLVAPNMYFVGNGGVIWYRGVRIGGVSGVYVEHNYERERFERPPYPRNQIKSVYHMRRQDVERMSRIRRPMDIFVSHDWPRGITEWGSLEELLKRKPFLKREIANGSFGNPGTRDLMRKLKPTFWFAAHMHVKFPALVKHDGGEVTRFLALDKPLPKRDFMQIVDIPIEDSGGGDEEFAIELDAEWLAILKTEGREAGRSTPVSEEEVQQVIRELQEQSVETKIRPVSDFERFAPVHDPNQRKMKVENQITLQPRNVLLLKALHLEEMDWIPGEKEVVAAAASNAVG